MKKKIFAIIFIACALCLSLCAFTVDTNSSLKSLTHPYINTYECTQAMLGKENLLEKYEYFRITLLNTKELEVSYKKKNGSKHVIKCPYTFDDESKVLQAEFGVLGFKFRQSTKIENGKFTVTMPIFDRQLIMNFKA